MSKKIRANRQFDDLFELAAYLNYYFNKNSDAELTPNDLKKIVDNNPSFSLEPFAIDNGFGRNIISDSNGNTIKLVMTPRFYVFEDEVEAGSPEDEEAPDGYEEVNEAEEVEAEEVEPEPEPEPEPEAEAEPESAERDLSFIREDAEVLWLDDDAHVHNVKVVAVNTEDGKLRRDNPYDTDVSIEHRDGSVTTAFPDELYDPDSDDVPDPDEFIYDSDHPSDPYEDGDDDDETIGTEE